MLCSYEQFDAVTFALVSMPAVTTGSYKTLSKVAVL